MSASDSLPAHRVLVDRSGAIPSLSFPRRYNLSGDLLDRALAAGRGEHPAYVDDTRRLTYTELAARAARVGNALLAAGVQPEQRIGVLLLDTVDFPCVFLGAIRAGIVPVALNTLMTAKDYAYMLGDSRARVVVVSAPLLPKLEEALAGLEDPPRVLVVGGEEDTFEALLAAAEPVLAPAPTTPDDVAFWLYSSGSTGAPKGTLHLHRSPVTTAVLFSEEILGLGPDDVVHSAAKLFFAYGLGNALTFPLWAGATAVLTAQRPTAAVVAGIMREHQPTLFCGVPTLFATLLADPAFADAVPERLRLCTSAGEALPPHLSQAWRERFGSEILDGIGSTEMLHIFLSNRPDDVRDGTTGRPVPGYQVELREPDGALIEGEGEGELWVSAPSAAQGYWNNRAKTLATFHGPWARTGDRYRRDAEGYYACAGRADDMLKVSGIWVSPFEVESALAQHPAVLEAAVVGYEHEGLIKPKAFVVLDSGASSGEDLSAELKAHVKGTLAPYKYPRWIEFVDSLPKTATGKIQRYKLRGC